MPTIDKTVLITDVRTILTGKVGVYLFPDSTVVPAISLLPDAEYGYDYPPTDVGRGGIECVVVEPDAVISNASNRHELSIAFNARWRVYLKQWDTTFDLVDAAETLTFGLVQRKYQVDSWRTTRASEELGLIRTIDFDILDSYLLYAA